MSIPTCPDYIKITQLVGGFEKEEMDEGLRNYIWNNFGGDSLKVVVPQSLEA